MVMTRDELIQTMSEQSHRAYDTLAAELISLKKTTHNEDKNKLKEFLKKTAQNARKSLLIAVTFLSGIQGVGATNLNNHQDTKPGQEKTITVTPQQDMEKMPLISLSELDLSDSLSQMPEISLPEIKTYEKVSLEEQFSTPASAHTDSHFLTTKTNIGDVTYDMIKNAGDIVWTNNYTQPGNETQAAKGFTLNTINNSLQETKEAGNLAFARGNDITIRRFDLSHQEQQDLMTNPTNEDYHFLGHTLAEIATYYHEIAHVQHTQNNLIHFKNETPAMSIEGGWQTEKVAKFVEISAAVNGYINLKNSGIKTLQFGDNLSAPIDAQLNTEYPGIMEIVGQKDFDLKSEKSLTELAQFASNYWDTRYSSTYVDVFIEKAKAFKNVKTQDILAYIENAKLQDQRSDMMCQNLDIGWGLRIDIPAGVRDLMKAPKEVVNNILHTANLEVKKEGKQITTLTTEGLLAIDNYMNQQGINNNRGEWLQKEYAKIVNREKDTNNELQAVLLQAGRYRHINYADNLYASYANNGKDLSYVLRGNDEVLVASQLEAFKDTASVQTKDTSKTTTDTAATNATVMAQIALNTTQTR